MSTGVFRSALMEMEAPQARPPAARPTRDLSIRRLPAVICSRARDFRRCIQLIWGVEFENFIARCTLSLLLDPTGDSGQHTVDDAS